MWVWDAPGGVYKNHALSSKIREAAAAQSLFMKYVSAEPNYGKGRGESATITRVMQLPLAGKVSEQERLPTGRPLVDTKQVTVSEWGFKTELTEFEESLTHFDLRSKFQRMLRDQMRLTLDKMVADALKTTPVKATNVAGAVTITNDGTPSGVTDTNLSIAAIREYRDYLFGVQKVPPFSNGMMIGILSTKCARGVRNDTDYKDWFSPTTSGPLENGRMKDIENIALFETNHFDALSNSIAGGESGEALFFGADAGFLATVTDPELRVGISEDLGRFRQIGWYGIIEAGITWDRPDESRVLHVTTGV